MDPRLKRLQQELASAVAGMSAVELNSRSPGKWSAAEILEHLYLTYTATTKALSRVLETGKPLAAAPTWKNRGRAFIVVGLGYLPSGREAPPSTRPQGTDAETVSADIGPKIAEMDDVMSRCAARLGSRTLVLDHPILGPLSIPEWRKFHLVHGLHHIKQIRRLRLPQR